MEACVPKTQTPRKKRIRMTKGGGIEDDDTRNAKAKEDNSDEASTDAKVTSDSFSLEKVPLSEYMGRMQEKYPPSLYEWPRTCEGPCGRSFPVYAHVNLCRMCFADICDDCLKLRKSGDRRAEKCSPKHDWLHVDAPELEAEEGRVFIRGKFISPEEFIERLRANWKA
jgi:ribosomal protein S14